MGRSPIPRSTRDDPGRRAWLYWGTQFAGFALPGAPYPVPIRDQLSAGIPDPIAGVIRSRKVGLREPEIPIISPPCSPRLLPSRLLP